MHEQIPPHNRSDVIKYFHEKEDPDKGQSFEEIDCVPQGKYLRTAYMLKNIPKL